METDPHPSPSGSEELPNLRHLTMLPLLAAGESLHGVADTLSISQPAATLALGRLERRYDVLFFDRGPRHLMANDYGRAAATRVSRALDFLRTGISAMLGHAEPPAGGARARAVDYVLQRLSIQKLRAIAATGQRGSCAGAAEALDLTQGALRRALNEIEALVGLPILIRGDGTFGLTSQAAAGAQKISLALAEIRAIGQDVDDLRGVFNGVLNIGSVASATSTLMPTVIPKVRERMPQAQLRIHGLDYEDMLTHLRHGQLDFVCTPARTELPEDICGETLFETDLCMIARADHPLAAARSPAAQELARHPWICAAADTGVAVRFRQVFEAEGVTPPAPFVETRIHELIRRLLETGEFLAIVTRAQLAADAFGRNIAVIDKTVVNNDRPVSLLRRRNWKPTALQSLFEELLHAEARRLQTVRTGPKPALAADMLSIPNPNK